MASNIISSIRVFDEQFEVAKDERYDALEKYFIRGGVISAVKSGKSWPKLVYPSPMRIDVQIKELEELKEVYSKKVNTWKEKLSQAKSYHQRHQVKKFAEPLYWKHVAKTLTDPDYKEDTKNVSLPVHLVADPKWKPMVKMFVKDLEYRKNLVETVQNSVVYKEDKKVGKYADVLQDFRSEISTTKIDDLSKKVSKLDVEIKSLQLIKKWSKE
ncbi:MAG: hypothetical protein CL944_00605 [Candidatus Diapherotrites archaeon]|uniref:Uncharacterized protein n=1 Tax=Candidatus Iainarchaeum sp. TaxID=3101447 RepID=A0A2D6LP51_9ARCH|nr:hypothetical protein [Candidatus Diapherotrites archaeon]